MVRFFFFFSILGVAVVLDKQQGAFSLENMFNRKENDLKHKIL